MAFDDRLAERIRMALRRRTGISEKRMFGGLCFLCDDHMFCGIVGELLMLRLGPEDAPMALTEPHTAEMDFTGKPMRGFVYVKPPGFSDEAALKRWLGRALSFVRTLPPKS